MPWVAAISALIPVVTGVIQSAAAKKKQNKVSLQPYQSPEEAKAALNFSQNLAQGGFAPEALNYLTQNIERSSANALNSVQRAGGTPNDVGNILDQELQAYMKVGAQDSMAQFQNFDRYLNSLGAMGQNADAEWADQRNLQKDQLAQAAMDKQQGFQNIMSGINTGVGLYAQNQQMNLYKDDIALQRERNAQFANMFGSSELPSVRSAYNPGTAPISMRPEAVQPVTLNPNAATQSWQNWYWNGKPM